MGGVTPTNVTLNMRIAIEGSIGAGKTTALAALRAAFPDVPVVAEPVDEWADIMDAFYDSPRQHALAFNTKVLLCFGPERCPPTCITERSPLAGRHVFGQLLFNKGLLDENEWDVYKRLHDRLGWQPDGVVYIDTPPEVCRRRVEERGRACEVTHVDLDYLRKVAFQYNNLLNYLPTVPIERVDGSLDSEEVGRRVCEAVRTLMADHVNPILFLTTPP